MWRTTRMWRYMAARVDSPRQGGRRELERYVCSGRQAGALCLLSATIWDSISGEIVAVSRHNKPFRRGWAESPRLAATRWPLGSAPRVRMRPPFLARVRMRPLKPCFVANSGRIGTLEKFYGRIGTLDAAARANRHSREAFRPDRHSREIMLTPTTHRPALNVGRGCEGARPSPSGANLSAQREGEESFSSPSVSPGGARAGAPPYAPSNNSLARSVIRCRRRDTCTWEIPRRSAIWACFSPSS